MGRSIFIVWLFLVAAPSFATTITFDDIHQAEGIDAQATYTEKGVLVTSEGGDFGYYDRPGAVHIDDYGTGLAFKIIVTTGSTFSAIRLDLNSFPSPLLSYDLADTTDPTGSTFVSGTIEAEGAVVRGYLRGKLIAEDRFSVANIRRYRFPWSFIYIDKLEIIADVNYDKAEATLLKMYPGYELISMYCVNDAPCSHFEVDGLKIMKHRRF